MPKEPKYAIDLGPEKVAIFERIAADHLFIHSLKTQHSDSLDFHDCAVWSVLRSLNDAYEAGFKAAAKAVAQA